MVDKINKRYTSTQMNDVIKILDDIPKDITTHALIKYLFEKGYRIVKVPE